MQAGESTSKLYMALAKKPQFLPVWVSLWGWLLLWQLASPCGRDGVKKG